MDHQSMIVNPQLFSDLQSEINLDRRRYLSCYNSSTIIKVVWFLRMKVLLELGHQREHMKIACSVFFFHRRLPFSFFCALAGTGTEHAFCLERGLLDEEIPIPS